MVMHGPCGLQDISRQLQEVGGKPQILTSTVFHVHKGSWNRIPVDNKGPVYKPVNLENPLDADQEIKIEEKKPSHHKGSKVVKNVRQSDQNCGIPLELPRGRVFLYQLPILKHKTEAYTDFQTKFKFYKNAF